VRRKALDIALIIELCGLDEVYVSLLQFAPLNVSGGLVLSEVCKQPPVAILNEAVG
jgi:hypothetical protein